MIEKADNSRGHVANEGVTVKATERSRESLMVRGLSRNSAHATPNAREAQKSSNRLRTTDIPATSTSYVKWEGRRGSFARNRTEATWLQVIVS
jgi:hypothetical protein